MLTSMHRSPPSNTQTPSPNSGLSKGATIAIAVLATTLGLLILLAIAYFWRRKRHSSKPRPSAFDPPTAASVQEVGGFPVTAKAPETKPEATVAAVATEFQPNELSGRNPPQYPETVELGTAHRAELQATGVPR